MKKTFLFLIATIALFVKFGCSVDEPSPSVKVKQFYTAYLDSLTNDIDELQTAVNSNAHQAMLQQQFLDARKAYKAVEIFAEYYNPSTAKAINGPALDEVEPDNPDYPTPPTGFQVIEELLFPIYDTSLHTALVKEVAALKAAVTRLNMVNESLELTDAHIFDAIRLEIFRMETLGLAGFDTPISFSSITELPFVLKSLQQYLAAYTTNKTAETWNRLDSLFNAAIAFATANAAFNNFDRAIYLSAYLNPLTKQLNQFQEIAGVPYFTEPRPLAANAATLFETDVFKPAFYTNSHKDAGSMELSVLGAQLFNESKLSVNKTRSCASCHMQSKAFTDGLAKNNSFDGSRTIHRNTPTILYVALQPALFADSRLAYLEDQAKQVIENPDEMHGNLSAAAVILERDSLYVKAFQQAFKEKGITPEKIQKAIAAYIRTHNKFSSSFDEYMRGDNAALNQNELAGFNLFMGKAKCGSCHFMPLFNGSVPPLFLKIESEVLGVPLFNKSPYQLDTDPGKYGIIRSEPYKNAFKTSTVRNSAATAPYMHNGVFETLEEVIDFYNNGGGTGLGLEVVNQTLSPDSLNLTIEEQRKIVAFLKALTDKKGY